MDDDITTDPVFLGLTRPATLLGVPLIPAVMSMLPVVLIFIATANPLMLLAGVPVWAVLALVTRSDPHRLNNALHWFATRAKCSRSARWWGAPTVSPRSTQRFDL